MRYRLMATVGRSFESPAASLPDTTVKSGMAMLSFLLPGPPVTLM